MRDALIDKADNIHSPASRAPPCISHQNDTSSEDTRTKELYSAWYASVVPCRGPFSANTTQASSESQSTSSKYRETTLIQHLVPSRYLPDQR
jgi:hypothetical protein